MRVIGKKTLPPTFVLLALGVMIGFHFLIPVATVIPWPWRLVGIVPLGFGVMINVMADGAFRKAGTTVKPFQQSSALVMDGVYSLNRHPMYLGIVLVVVGMACFMGSLTPFVVVPLLVFLLDRRFIRIEERMLEDRFGEDWLRYKARVRRWI